MDKASDDQQRDAILKRMLETRPGPRKANPYRLKKKAKKKKAK